MRWHWSGTRIPPLVVGIHAIHPERASFQTHMNQALLTALGAAAGFVVKSLWDVYWKRREETASLARSKRIELLERQLSLFYWPLYLHLQKNNVIWERIVQGRSINDALKNKVDAALYTTFFLPNHEIMVKIIESNVHLAQPDVGFENLLLRFIRHVTIFRTMRDVGLPYDPIAVGEPWPAEFFPAVETRLKSLQERYDSEIGSQSILRSVGESHDR